MKKFLQSQSIIGFIKLKEKYAYFKRIRII